MEMTIRLLDAMRAKDVELECLVRACLVWNAVLTSAFVFAYIELKARFEKAKREFAKACRDALTMKGGAQ